MEIKSVEVFSEATNYGIVRMPGRQFPGCVIQGDSLSILLAGAREVLERVAGSGDEELVGCAEDLVEKLQSHLDHYQQVMRAHEIPLPFTPRARDASDAIRVMAICVFRHGNKILVTEGVDSVTQSRFARPLGGGVELGERSADAAAREIKEEIGADVTGLRLLGVLENLFVYEGKQRHEIIFVHEGEFVDGALYGREEIEMHEAGWTTPAVWREISSFGETCRLVPDGLADLLEGG